MAKPSRLLLIGALALGAVACSSSDDAASDTTGAATETTAAAADTTEAAAEETTTSAAPATDAPTTTEAPSTTVAPEPLRILVTNDDGYAAPGIDAVVTAMAAGLDNVEITVIAPAENQSGTSDKMTGGTLTATDVALTSGAAAKAVAGFPADTIIYALDQGGLAEAPDLVVSGINVGQNVGPFVEISGTVGAARTAAKRGIPAIASSQQIFDAAGQPVPGAYPDTAAAIVAWIEQNFDNLLAGSMPAYVYNFNGPTCTDGPIRGLVTVPLAVADGQDFGAPAVCSGAEPAAPTDDLDAIVKGYIAYTEIDPNTLAAIG